jgi:ATP-dependent Clp protease ATP-binding subunit ClpC
MVCVIIVRLRAGTLLQSHTMDWFEEAKEGLAREKSADKARRDSFTASALRALDGAFDEARRLNHDFIGAEHVLLGLVRLRNGLVPKVIGSSGLHIESLRSEIEKYRGACAKELLPDRLPFTPRVKRIIRNARSDAKERGLSRVGAEQLLGGLLREPDGVPAKLFKKLGVDVQAIQNQLLAGITAT